MGFNLIKALRNSDTGIPKLFDIDESTDETFSLFSYSCEAISININSNFTIRFVEQELSILSRFRCEINKYNSTQLVRGLN